MRKVVTGIIQVLALGLTGCGQKWATSSKYK